MHPRLWHAIDQIGGRPASRFEWKLTSSLDWPDLEPFLTVCPGRAEDVPDPGDGLEMLVVWKKEDGTAILESSQIPGHRDPIFVSVEDLRLYRANVNVLGQQLAAKLNFTAQPSVGSGPVLRIGIVQIKAKPQVPVHLFIPDANPLVSDAALRAAGNQDDEMMLLLPSARWLSCLPKLKPAIQVRVPSDYLSLDEEESLTTIAAKTSPRGAQFRRASVLQVRSGDRWEDVKMVFSADTGKMQIRIEQRSLEVEIWNHRRRSQRRAKSGANRSAQILVMIAASDSKGWDNASVTESERETMRRGFQLLKKRLANWVPVADGEPFVYDRTTKIHRPRFALEVKGINLK